MPRTLQRPYVDLCVNQQITCLLSLYAQPLVSNVAITLVCQMGPVHFSWVKSYYLSCVNVHLLVKHTGETLLPSEENDLLNKLETPSDFGGQGPIPLRILKLRLSSLYLIPIRKLRSILTFLMEINFRILSRMVPRAGSRIRDKLVCVFIMFHKCGP